MVASSTRCKLDHTTR